LTGILLLTGSQLALFVVAAFIRWGGKHKQKHQEEHQEQNKNWTRHYDSTSGCYFLEHCSTGETKWEEEIEKNSSNHRSAKPPTSLRAMALVWLAQMQGQLFVVMSFGFPLVSKYVLNVLHCVPESESSATFQNETVLIMHSAPTRTVCWEGTHVSLAVLAVLTIIFYMVGYPLISFFYLRRVVKNTTRSKLRLARWDHFIGDDYSPQYYWFRHVYWALHLSVLLVYECSERGISRCLSVIALLLCYTLLLLFFRPFSPLDKWKLYVRVPLVLCSVLIAVLDVVKFYEVVEDVEVGMYGSTVFAYLVFINCMGLLLLLPGTFFAVNYGLRCCKRKETNEQSYPAVSLEMTSMEEMKEEHGEDWTRHLDKESGHYYLLHRISGVVKWEMNSDDMGLSIQNPMTDSGKFFRSTG
jgi:hypothetical protein